MNASPVNSVLRMRTVEITNGLSFAARFFCRARAEMNPMGDLQAVHARIRALEAELEAATEQLEAFGFRVVFDDPAPAPPHTPHPLPWSKYTGVSWSRTRRMWRAQMAATNAGGPAKSLDYFVNEIDAALAWDREARIRGLFRKLNFPTP